MRQHILLVVILLVAAAIRLFDLGERVLWIDEQQTVLEANGIGENVSFSLENGFTSQEFKNEKGISNMIRANAERDSGNGFFYIMMVSWWTGFFGNSNLSVRMVSVIFSLLTSVVIFYLARDLFESENVAYWSSFLFSIHHLSFISGQEARSYAIGTFLITLSTALFFRICNWDGKPRGLEIFSFGLCSGLALLSHYLTCYIIFSQVLVAVLFYRKAAVWKSLVGAGFLASLVVLCWMVNGGLYGLKFMGARSEMYHTLSLMDPGNAFYGKADFRTIVTGLFQMITHLFGIGFQYGGLRIREAIPFLVIPSLILFLNIKMLKERKESYIPLIILGLAAPLFAMLLAIMSGHTVSFQVLYANFSLAFVCIILGSLFESTWRNGGLLSRSMVVAYLLMMSASSLFIMVKERHDAGESRNLEAVAKELESNYQPGDTLIFATSQEALLRNLYFRNPAIFQKVGDTLRHQDLYLEDIHR